MASPLHHVCRVSFELAATLCPNVSFIPCLPGSGCWIVKSSLKERRW